MAKPNKPNRKPPVQVKGKKPLPQKTKQVATSLFENLNKWFGSKAFTITTIAFVFTTLFSLLLFQARMDIGGDDSGYILRAYDFVHKGTFPNYQGPLYPLFLSIFISLFGIKIVLLKFLSILFNFFALFFFYKTFKDRLPAVIFFPVLLITAINGYILSFASLTYSEACYMFIQSLLFFYFFRLVDKLSKLETFSIKETYPDFLFTALFVFLLSLARSIGLFAFPAILLYFLLRREFKYAGYFTASFAAVEVVVGLIKKIFFHVATQWGAERSALLLKDQYNPSAGAETVSGFGARFIGNCNVYLSKRFFQVIGLRSADAIDVSHLLTFLFIVFALFALYRTIKSKNNVVFAIVIYCGIMLASTFLGVQVSIDQPRFVMVYVPLLLLMFFYAIYDSLKNAPWVAQSLLLYLIVILLITGLVGVMGRAKDNLSVLSKNFHGDLYYGFTPDWDNYIRASQWCADNLPSGSLVATRKAEVSFIYTDKEIFFPVYKVYSSNPDSVLDYFKKHNVNYVMLANLRGNAKVADGNIITTLWRMIQPVAQKYPQKLKLVHQEGSAEQAYIYQILN